MILILKTLVMNNRTKNLFDNLPSQLPNELFQTLLENHHVKIERIISRGHASLQDQWYDQSQDEWVILLQGQARLQFATDRAIITLKAGDYLFIPAHEKHRVEWTDPTCENIWLAIHLY
jgi:cupin 2 domain-containing protein